MFEHDEKLARWFAEHNGIIGVEARDELGVPWGATFRRSRSGLLLREHPGVYRSAAVPASFDTRLRAAIAATRQGGYVSGHSLMRLYATRGEWGDTPEILLVGTEHLVLEGVRIRRIDRIDPSDIRNRSGLPALAPPLGLLLLGASASPWKVQTAVHDMVFQGHTARPQLIDVLKRYGGRGRRGVKSFRLAVKSLDPKGKATQTNHELVVVRAIAGVRSIPEPHLQLRVVDGDDRKRKLDIAWPDHGLDLETDGDRWHLTPSDRAEMARRDDALERVGFETWRVDSDDVAMRLPELVARLRRFFGS